MRIEGRGSAREKIVSRRVVVGAGCDDAEVAVHDDAGAWPCVRFGAPPKIQSEPCLQGANEFAAGKTRSPPSWTVADRPWRAAGLAVGTVESSVAPRVWTWGTVACGRSLGMTIRGVRLDDSAGEAPRGWRGFLPFATRGQGRGMPLQAIPCSLFPIPCRSKRLPRNDSHLYFPHGTSHRPNPRHTSGTFPRAHDRFAAARRPQRRRSPAHVL
jgi:hypothetical protein